MTTLRSATPGKKKKDKYERYKIASIPLLLGVLVYVLMNPDEKQSAPNAETPLTKSNSTNIAATPPPLDPTTNHRKEGSKSPWPEVSLDFAAAMDVRSNPLARIGMDQANSTAHPVAETESVLPATNEVNLTSEIARELAQQPVKYVFKSADSRFVMLGDQIYQEGQSIAPSVQLHSIEENILIIGPQ